MHRSVAWQINSVKISTISYSFWHGWVLEFVWESAAIIYLSSAFLPYFALHVLIVKLWLGSRLAMASANFDYQSTVASKWTRNNVHPNPWRIPAPLIQKAQECLEAHQNPAGWFSCTIFHVNLLEGATESMMWELAAQWSTGTGSSLEAAQTGSRDYRSTCHKREPVSSL